LVDIKVRVLIIESTHHPLLPTFQKSHNS